MRLPAYDECASDSSYLSAIEAYGDWHGVQRSPHDTDESYALKVRCHSAGLPLGVYTERYACTMRIADPGVELVVWDTESETEVCTVREGHALEVLAALSMYDRAAKRA